MTADIATQKKSTAPSTLLHTLTMALAALTLFFALIAMILGNRLTTLRTYSLAVEKETALVETTSIWAMETALKTATGNLGAAQQALGEEKAATERLRRQLAAVMKELENTKAELDHATQVIARLKAMPPQPTDSSTDPSAPAQTQAGTADPAQASPPSAPAGQ
jgi:hypothetical protein